MYHDANGNATKDKGYAGLLVAQATGTNKQGTTTYNLTLYDQNKVVATGTGFSGNNNYANTGAIKDGNYQILGRFDAPPTAPNPASPASTCFSAPIIWASVCLLFDILSSPFFRTNHSQVCAETGEQVSRKRHSRNPRSGRGARAIGEKGRSARGSFPTNLPTKLCQLQEFSLMSRPRQKQSRSLQVLVKSTLRHTLAPCCLF